MSDYFPLQVIAEILCKLPVKSLLRCMCVCKSWYSLIKSPNFITAHLRNSNNNNNNVVLLFRHSVYDGEEIFSLHLDDNEFSDHCQLPLSPKLCNLFTWNQVIGSCNGVLCVVHHGENPMDSLFLWNPLLGKSIFLERSTSFVLHKGFPREYFGFGFDSRASDYKLLRILQFLDRNSFKQMFIEFEVYSLKAGYWKTLNSIAPKIEIDRGDRRLVFVNGFLHFACFRRIKNAVHDDDVDGFCNSILAFDISEEVFHEVMLPNSLPGERENHFSVLVYRESTIAVIEENAFTSNFRIWVMKEYGVESSWTELFIVKEYIRPIRGAVSGLVAFRKNGEVLLQTSVQTSDENFSGGILTYDPETQQFKELRFWWKEYNKFVFSYVESLVLLDAPGTRDYISHQSEFPFQFRAAAEPSISGIRFGLAEDEQASDVEFNSHTDAEGPPSEANETFDSEIEAIPALPLAIVASEGGSSFATSDKNELAELVTQLATFEETLDIDPILPESSGELVSFHCSNRYPAEVAKIFQVALSLLECGPIILSDSGNIADLRQYLELLISYGPKAGVQAGQSRALENILKDLDQIVQDFSMQRQRVEVTELTRALLGNMKAAFSSEFGKLKAEMRKEKSLARQIAKLEAKLEALKAEHASSQDEVKNLATSSLALTDAVATKRSRLQNLVHSEAEAKTRLRQIEEMFTLAVDQMKASSV